MGHAALLEVEDQGEPVEEGVGGQLDGPKPELVTIVGALTPVFVTGSSGGGGHRPSSQPSASSNAERRGAIASGEFGSTLWAATIISSSSAVVLTP